MEPGKRPIPTDRLSIGTGRRACRAVCGVEHLCLAKADQARRASPCSSGPCGGSGAWAHSRDGNALSPGPPGLDSLAHGGP